MSNLGPSWTDDRIAELRKHKAEGFSASQIAMLLGGITRSAVIGKLHRLGIVTHKPKLDGKYHARPKPERRTPFVRPKPTTPRPDLGIEVDAIKDLPADQSEFACSIMELNDDTCRWPLGEPTPDMKYCGDRKCSGAYCHRHARIAYMPGRRW